MAVNAAKAGELAAVEIIHPLLGGRVAQSANSFTYKAKFEAASQWVLNEHKIMGVPTVPGTAYLEMARAAWQDITAMSKLQISDIYFLAPLSLGDDQWRLVSTEVTQRVQADESDKVHRYDFVISSRLFAKGAVIEHARGKLTAIPQAIAQAQPVDLEALWLNSEAKKIDDLKQAQNTEQASGSTVKLQALSCGPRWDVFKRIAMAKDQTGKSNNQGLAQLTLDPTFAFELDQYQLHPSLLDCAAAFVRPFIEADFFYPLYYRQIQQFRPISATCISHATKVPTNDKDTLDFNVNIYDEVGQLCLAIEGFSMRRMNQSTEPKINDEQTTIPNDGGSAVILQGLSNSEGVDAVKLVLGGTEPNVVVTVMDFEQQVQYYQDLDITSMLTPQNQQTLSPRPDLMSAYVPPRTDTEKQLASLWQQQLGIEKVGVQDEFFELGGDSLVLMQVHAQLSQVTDKSVPIAELYNHPTIKGLANSIDNSGQQGGDEQVQKADQRAMQMKKAMRNRRRSR
jgi:acyl carrier protein